MNAVSSAKPIVAPAQTTLDSIWGLKRGNLHSTCTLPTRRKKKKENVLATLHMQSSLKKVCCPAQLFNRLATVQRQSRMLRRMFVSIGLAVGCELQQAEAQQELRFPVEAEQPSDALKTFIVL